MIHLSGKVQFRVVPIPFRADLRAFLTEFVEQHRGVRLGQMFGLPAGYVGRRLFVCLIEDGVIVRLPPDVAQREIRTRGEPYSRRGRVLGMWVMYRPRSIAAARRLVPVLEVAARHIAERQLPTPNSQDSTSQTWLGSCGVGRWDLGRKRK
ncbi:MAG: hypothetical protein HYY76_00605 [Acidobacteria bacterium]|nr:hypothetical protein [Acidobacteriota bacterium]